MINPSEAEAVLLVVITYRSFRFRFASVTSTVTSLPSIVVEFCEEKYSLRSYPLFLKDSVRISL